MFKAYQRRNIQNFPLEVDPFSCTFAIVTDGCLPCLQQQPGVIGESHTHICLRVSSLFYMTSLPPSTHNTVNPRRARSQNLVDGEEQHKKKNHSEYGSIYTGLLTIIGTHEVHVHNVEYLLEK